MKAITIIVRVLIGLILLYASCCFFLKIAPEPAVIGEFKAFQIGQMVYDYLMPFSKAIELICAIAFLSGRFVTLANVIILPVSLNILLVNYFISPDTLPIAIALFLGNLFLIYRYWDNYKLVFTP